MTNPGLAGWLVRHRAPRIALMAALFPLPAFGVVSVAMVVLATQINGWRTAALDCAAALGLLLGLTMAGGGEWRGMGLGASLAWLVGLVLGAIRRPGSLNLPVQVAVLMGFAGVIVFHGIADDAQAYWAGVLRELTERATAAGMELGPTELLLGAAAWMTGVVAASAVASSVAALLLGSWWASRLGVGEVAGDFRSLRMGRVIGGLALLSVIAWLAGLRGLADDLWFVFGAGFALQGLAVVHWHAARRRWPRWWSFALYLPMLGLPALAAAELLVLAIVGVVDNAYSLRRATADVV